jgi:hypothetical protein
MLLNTQITIEQDVEDSIMSDAYSTGVFDIEIDTEKLRLRGPLQNIYQEEVVQSVVTIPQDAPLIGSALFATSTPIASKLPPEPGEPVEGILTITFVYMPAGGGEIQSIKQDVPFVTTFGGRIPADTLVLLSSISCDTAQITGDRVEVKTTLALSGTYVPVTEGIVMTNAKYKEEETEPTHGLTLSYSTPGQSLWSLGKQYRMPVEQIIKLNPGIPEELTGAEQVLIYKPLENF